MKKLISLLLAVMMALTTLPALAETSLSDLFSGFTTGATTEEAFPYTAEEYKATFDMISGLLLSVTPTWKTEGNVYTASIPGYADVVVETNAAGNVTKLSTGMGFSTSDTSGAEKLGMLIALVSLASKGTEDLAFLENSVDFTNAIVQVLYELLSRIAEALNGPVTSTGEVYGDTVSFTMSLDMASMYINLSFAYEP